MKIILIAIFLAVTLQSCIDKDDPVIPIPKDTCEGRQNLVPKILIYEDRGNTKEPFLATEDTVLTANDITFEAPEGFVSYRWKIGNDEREFNSRKVTFWFHDPWGNLSVRLIVRNPLECFNYPKEYDTIYRNIYIKQWQKAKIIGEYLGANDDNPKDTFTVGIILEKYEPTPTEWYVVNIHRGCGKFSTSSYKKALITNKRVLIEANTQDAFDECLYPMGIGYLVPGDEDSLIFNYAWGKFDKGDTIKNTFRGRRVK